MAAGDALPLLLPPPPPPPTAKPAATNGAGDMASSISLCTPPRDAATSRAHDGGSCASHGSRSWSRHLTCCITIYASALPCSTVSVFTRSVPASGGRRRQKEKRARASAAAMNAS